MFKLSDEDEDSFFTPITNSNLASLFNTTMVTADSHSNTNLTYSAPKEPQKNKTQNVQNSEKDRGVSPSQKPQSSVIIAKVVHAFKLNNNKYVLLGKLGFALVGSTPSGHYQLILYQGKNDYKMTTKVPPSFQLSIQENNYVSFYDDQKQNWSVMFNNDNDMTEFLHELDVCGAKLNYIKQAVTDSTKPLLPEKPEHLHHESEKSTPIKSRVDSPSLDSQSDNSIKSKSKESILSRMAKMGQPILPNFTSPNHKSDITDSDTEPDRIERKTVKKQVKRIPLSEPETNIQAQVQRYNRTIDPIVPLNITSPIMHNIHETYQQMTPSNAPLQIMPIMQANPISPEALNVYFAENRTHNSEVRMCMMKLESKIDKVLDKIENSKSYDIEMKLNKMQMLLNSNNKPLNAPDVFINENSHEKNELDLKLKTYEENLEKLNEYEKELIESKEVVKIYEDKIKILELKLNDFVGYFDNHKNDSAKHEIKIGEYEKQIDDLQSELDNVKESREKDKEAQTMLENKCTEYEKEINDLKSKISNFEKSCNDLVKNNEEFSREIEHYKSKLIECSNKSSSSELQKILESAIKQTMNDLYSHLAAGDQDVKAVIVESTYKLISKVTESAKTALISAEIE